MKVLIAGSNGQLGFELARSAPLDAELVSLGRDGLDITDRDQVLATVARHQPDAIINAAAYTAVDKAESEPDVAMAVNRDGAAHLAAAAAELDAALVQVSTDFIFDGSSSTPYATDATPAPLGVYGATKLAGELAVRELLGEQALILRTAWVYSSHGNNFVKTILRLASEKPQLGIVADQVGSPTWAGGLAQAIWQALDRGVTGIHHWTDAGVASWYDFAVAIQEEAMHAGLLEREIPILPIRTEDYPTPAKRPPFSLLDKHATWTALALPPEHWRIALRRMLSEIPH
jgi:dTDP-4-dehydrorhamnose reductase